MSMKDTSEIAGILLASNSAISSAVVVSWRTIDVSGKIIDSPFLLVACGVWSGITRHSVRLHWVCLGLFIPSDLCWLFPFIHGHGQAEPQPLAPLPHAEEKRHKWGKRGEGATLPCLPAHGGGTVNKDGDQLAHVNYDSGLNIKGWRYKEQRCEQREEAKEERIGVMLQEEVFARSKGLNSMR